MSQSGHSSINPSFSGKKVLITGGGKGVGRALVERLYKDGASVYTPEQDADLVVQLRKDFPLIRAETCDISKWSETQKLIDSFGPFDHLVNNAGIIRVEDFLGVPEDSVDKIIDVNLKGVYCVSQAVARGMVAKGEGGTIVSVASIGVYVATNRVSVYTATKAGVLMLMKSLALELGKYNIRANCVSPGCIDTPMWKQFSGNELPKDFYANRQPLKGTFVLKPDQVVDSILFMLSPLSSLMTGKDIVLDGGISVW